MSILGPLRGKPGVPDGVGAKKGEHAPVLGDAADFVHLPPFGRRVSWRNLSDWAGALLGYIRLQKTPEFTNQSLVSCSIADNTN